MLGRYVDPMNADDPAPRAAVPVALERIADAWGLTQAEANAIAGNSTEQPSDSGSRAEAAGKRIAVLLEATELLKTHIKREQIPVVVRRTAAGQTNRSLLDIATAGDAIGVLAACTAMFSFDDITSGVDTVSYTHLTLPTNREV